MELSEVMNMPEVKEMPATLVEFLKQLKEENVAKEEYPQRIDRFLGKKAWLKGIPYSGQFELTPLCNLDCRMCYVHLQKEQMKHARLLSVDQWISFIDQVFAAGMRKATLTGGECLTYQGFDEIYRYLLSLGVRVSVLTNGVLLDHQRIEFFKKYLPSEIRISLYGSCNEIYKQVTGSEVFDSVWDNLQMAKAAGLPLKISITPNKFMEADAESLIEKVHSAGIPYVINSGLIEPREDTGRGADEIEASMEAYLRIYRKRMQLNDAACVPVEDASLPDAKKDGEKKCGILCGAGMNSFQICWDGTMYPCTNLRLYHAEPLEDGFASAWEQLQDAVKSMDIPAECDGCPYEALCGPCVVPHIQDGKTDRCSQAYCQRVRRLVSEGIFELADEDCLS